MNYTLIIICLIVVSFFFLKGKKENFDFYNPGEEKDDYVNSNFYDLDQDIPETSGLNNYNHALNYNLIPQIC